MDSRRATLVPELLVTDIAASLRFWVDLCGFSIMYRRADEGFAYLDLAGAQIMLVEVQGDGYWVTGRLDPPRGRGVNFQIDVPSVDPLVSAFAAVGRQMFQGIEEKWYRSHDVEIGVREFLVQDPDGYLLRFSARVGERPSKACR